jgi:hypothetical protein
MRRRRQTKSLFGGTLGARALTIGELDTLMDLAIALSTGGNGSADELYRVVSWIFWCVNRRADAIGQMPFAIYPLGVEDDDPDKEVKDFPVDLRPMLWQAEAWLALEGWAFVHNRLPDKLQVLNAYTMKVKEHDQDGPTVFEQQYKGKKVRFDAEEIVYFRLWNPRDDINAGTAPSSPANVPGQVIEATNEWPNKFFKNGAIPAVLLTTEGSPPERERQRIESKWNERLQGVANAFRTYVMGHGLKPEVIGQPVSELAMPELSKDKKEQILAAFKMPPGFAEPRVAQAERRELKTEAYEFCYIPEWEVWIEPVINEQLLNPLGLRLSANPNELEIFQRQELEKAESAAFFVSGMMLPMYKENTVKIDEVRRVANSILGAASLPELDKEFTPEERTPPALQPFAGQQPQEGGDTIEGAPTSTEDRIEQRTGKALSDELDKWERLAVKRIKEGRPDKALRFASDVIPALMHSLIVHDLEKALTLGDVVETFKAARGEKQIQFIPEGQGDPLPAVPNEVTFSDADLDRAIKSWDKLMPDFAGLLEADVIHRENYDDAGSLDLG